MDSWVWCLANPGYNLPKRGVVLGGWSLAEWHTAGKVGWTPRGTRHAPAWERTYGGYTANEWAEWAEEWALYNEWWQS